MSNKKERTKVQDIEKALSQDERIEMWISKNWKKCAVGAIVLIVAVVIGFIIFLKHQEDIRNKSIAIAEAEAENLSELLADNPDVPGANTARIRLAHYLENEKKDYISAGNVYNRIAADTTLPASLRNEARLSSAGCLEAAGKKEEARDAYLSISNDSTVSQSVKCEAAMQAARLLLALGERAQAEELLQGLADMEIPAGGEVAVGVQMSKMYAQIMLAAIRNGDYD